MPRATEVQRLEQAALGILPPAAFVHPCTAHTGDAVTKRMLLLIDHQTVDVADRYAAEFLEVIAEHA